MESTAQLPCAGRFDMLGSDGPQTTARIDRRIIIMPDVVIRISLLTRINIILGVLAVSLAPLLWTWRAIQNGEMDQLGWISLVAQVALGQFLLWHAQKRCSSRDLTYWQGVAVVAASIRTHWVYRMCCWHCWYCR